MKTIDALLKGSAKIDEDVQTKFDKYDAYIAGKAPLEFLAPEVREATKGRLQTATVNYARVVVGALEERLQVKGFRLDEKFEPSAWDLWQANEMDEQSVFAHQDALTYGRSYLLVWIGADGQPQITAESPRQMYVKHVPGSRRRLYAVKRWVDEDEHGRATVLTPSTVQLFRSVGKITATGDDSPPVFTMTSTGWNSIATYPNPLGVVPVIPIINRGRTLMTDGESELADLLPILDAINKTVTDMLVAGEFVAMPRRWVTGLTLPEKKDDQGKPTGEVDTDAFDPVAGRLWYSESDQTRFGEFPGADLAGFTNALDKLVLTLASLASLPLHMVGITTVNPASADALRASEASLAVKARRRQQAFSGAYEEAMRIAFAIRDGHWDQRLVRLQTIWNDAETRTLAQTADAALKLVAGGVIPVEQALEDIGYTPTQITRIQQMRAREPRKEIER